MKIADISESYYDVVNDRIKKDGGRDLDKSREWYKQNIKDVKKRMRSSGNDVDQAEYDKWRKGAGIKTEDSGLLNKPTPSVKELAKKHNSSPEKIIAQLKKGIAIELEHTADREIAKEIALDHLAEFPDYYDRLAKAEEDKLDEAPMVVNHSDAIRQAVARTQKWLEQAVGDNRNLEVLNMLGDIVGFQVIHRGIGNKVMFQDKGTE